MSGGFAVVQPDSQLSVNAVEGFPLEDFSSEVCYDRCLISLEYYITNVDFSFQTKAVKNQIAEAQKIASGSGSEQDIAEAKIELEVCHAPWLLSA